MKHGFRKPSFTKSIAARTVGAAKRNLLRSIFPSYGKNGMGVFHPIRSSYNKLYKATTFGINDIYKNTSSKAYNKTSLKLNDSYEKIIIRWENEINKTIEKINKENNIVNFFTELKSLDTLINTMKSYEKEYSFTLNRSSNLEIKIKNNKDQWIYKFIDRYFYNLEQKLFTLKTKKAKLNNLISAETSFNIFAELLNEKNKNLVGIWLDKLQKMTN